MQKGKLAASTLTQRPVLGKTSTIQRPVPIGGLPIIHAQQPINFPSFRGGGRPPGFGNYPISILKAFAKAVKIRNSGTKAQLVTRLNYYNRISSGDAKQAFNLFIKRKKLRR